MPQDQARAESRWTAAQIRADARRARRAAFKRQLRARLWLAIQLAVGAGSRLIGGAGVVALASVAHVTGVTAHLDGFIYDLMVAAAPDPAPTSRRVTLIDLPADPNLAPLPGHDWQRLIDALAGAGARLIAATVPPPDGVTPPARVPLVIGTPVAPVPERPGQWAPIGGSGAPDDPVVAIALPEHGVHRRQAVTLETSTGVRPTLEATIAARLGGPERVPVAPFLIDYRGDPDAMPRLAAIRVIDGGLVPGLVDGRVVVIGPAPAPGTRGLTVPLRGLAEGLSPLKVHGYALETLLGARAPRPLTAVETAALLAVAVLIGYLIQRPVSGPASQLVFAATLVAVGALSFGALVGFDLVVPYTALTAALIAIFAVVRIDRARTRHRDLTRLVLALAARTHERLFPQLPETSQEQWGQIIIMVSQVLNLRRAIFLEADPVHPQVREVAALGCAIADIAEKRRDSRRPPYTDAIAAGSLIPLDRRQFLAPLADGTDSQFLAPLVFGGEVMGFWCLTVAADEGTPMPQFVGAVDRFSAQIAERLYFRRELEASRQASEQPPARVDERARLETQLRRMVLLLERRQVLLECILNREATAKIVYDLFGNVLQINERMTEAVALRDIRPFALSAVEFIHAVSGIAIETCRSYIRVVVTARQRLYLPVYLDFSGRQFVLALASIDRLGDRDVGGIDDEAGGGLLCELIDVSYVDALHQMKQEIWQFINMSLRNDLEAVLLAAELLADPRLKPDDRPSTITLFQDAADQARSRLADLQDFADREGHLAALDICPTPPRDLLERLIEARRPAFAARGIAISFDAPMLPALVLAGPDALDAGLGAILDLLAEDAHDDATLSIAIDEQEVVTTIHLSAPGFGLPDDQLHAYLAGTKPTDSDTFLAIRRLAMVIEAWQGRLVSHAEPGAGYRFAVALARVI